MRKRRGGAAKQQKLWATAYEEFSFFWFSVLAHCLVVADQRVKVLWVGHRGGHWHARLRRVWCGLCGLSIHHKLRLCTCLYSKLFVQLEMFTP